MADYDVSDLVKETKVVLDRNQESAELLPTDSDTLSQGEIIRSKIVDAARMVMESCPAEKLDGIKLEDMEASWMEDNGAYVGTMYLPSDFLRLLSVKAEGWRRPGRIITENDEEYALQGCKYGVRGNPERPIAAIVHSEGGRYVELYTSNKDDVGVDFTYVVEPSISSSEDGKETIELPKGLKDAIVYMAGYLTCITLGDNDTAGGILAIANKLAGIVVESS